MQHGRSSSDRTSLSTVRPGDMLGFSGRDLAAGVINLATWGVPYLPLVPASLAGLSHVGLAVADPDRPGAVLLYESTCLLRRPCVRLGRRVCGVQAQFLRVRVRQYCGAVWHYPLAQPLTERESADLRQFADRMLGVSYDWSGAFAARHLPLGRLRRLLLAAGGRDRREQALHSLFCSEFVAAALDGLGRFTTLSPQSWSPNALARAGLDRRVFLPPARLQ